jgi:dihydroorotase
MVLSITKPDDMHIHLREEANLQAYASDSAAWFRRGIVMPNTSRPILTPEDVNRYKAEIAKAAPGFTPLMTFKITQEAKPSHIKALKEAGVLAGKYYPRGATTNSSDGGDEVSDFFPLFTEMEKCGLVLSVHCEDPEAPVLERETAFLPHIERIVRNFPSLRVVVEHVSSKDTLGFLKAMPATVGATITVHHLLLTLDDLLGGGINPHLFCKPVVKTKKDRDALREAAFSGDRRFFFGSDSAPHPRAAKECGSGAGGIYSSPVALPLLAELFADNGAAGRLSDFTGRYGAEFYSLPLNEGQLTLGEDPWIVPAEYHGVVPLWAGRSVRFRKILP